MGVTAWVVLAIVVDGLAGLAGGLIPERLLERHRALLLGFAVGALLAAVAFDLAPEAYAALGWRAAAWAGGGLLAIMAIEYIVGHRHGAHDDEPGRRDARVLRYSLLGSDALHNFGDGMAIAAAFVQSVHLGLGTSLAVIVHEVPEEIADYALLRAGGLPRGQALAALGAVQLTAGLGAAVTLAGVSRVDSFADVAIAVAAGTFIAIVLQLAPPLARDRDRRGPALLGVVVGAVAVFAVS